MNTNVLRINNEIEIYKYFKRNIDIDLCKKLILEILLLNDYSELENKFLSFAINSQNDIFLNEQLKIIFKSDFNINIFLFDINKIKYYKIENQRGAGFELKEININEFLFYEFESLSLISSDLLICKNLLLKFFSKINLNNFTKLTRNIYILPTSYLLNEFNNNENLEGKAKLLNENSFSKGKITYNNEFINKINLKEKDNFSKKTFNNENINVSKSQFYIAWPKDKVNKKLLLDKVLLDCDKDGKHDSNRLEIDELIPNSVIRNFDQNAIIYDEKFLKNGSTYYPQFFSFHLKPNNIKPKHLHAYLNHGGGGNDVIEAIVDSLNLSFSFAEDFEDLSDGIPVVWGVLRNSKTIIDFAKRIGQYFYYIDHAYFNRGHKRSYRITRNYFEAGPVKKCPNDRLEKLDISLQDWKRGGQKILVCPPTEYFQEAHLEHNWLTTTLNTLKKHTDKKIVIRRKPKPGSNIKPLEEALKEAFALVTHSSNVAVEAVIAGVPVFVANSSACAPVGITDFSRIESPIYPNRDPWLAHLAYSQFSYEEIENGKFFEIMRNYEDFDFI